jgi:hypothetical protein
MHNPVAIGPAIAILLIVILYAPLVYFGLLLLLNPARFVPILGSITGELFRLNLHLQRHQWSREPGPIRDTPALRTGLRFAGISVLVFGFARLAETLYRLLR